ncbi:MAG: hypothetical protein ACR2H7_08195 [Actinomycetota bacterium]|jgi:hypothetical protein
MAVVERRIRRREAPETRPSEDRKLNHCHRSDATRGTEADRSDH